MNGEESPTKPAVLVDQNCLHVGRFLRRRDYTVVEALPSIGNGALQDMANKDGLVVVTRDTDWRDEAMHRRRRTGAILIENNIPKQGMSDDALYVLTHHAEDLSSGKGLEAIHRGRGIAPEVKDMEKRRVKTRPDE